MALYTEKSAQEILNPLSSYSGDNNYVQGMLYSMMNGGDLYNYARNYGAYKNALEASKANDEDNFFSNIGDFLVGRDTDKLKADIADEYLKAYAGNPYEFAGSDYQNLIDSTKSEYDPSQGRFLHGGIIGSILNPMTQTATAVGDKIQKWLGDSSDWDARDKASDVGASLTNLFNVLSSANLLGNTASTGAKIGIGAGTGALENAAYNLYENGSNTNMNDLLYSAAIGGAFGGAIPAIGAVAGKIGNKVATTGRNAIANQAMQQGYDQALANQIAQNTGRGTQIAAGIGNTTKNLFKSKPGRLGAAVGGGMLLSNMFNTKNNNANNQTGYNDNAVYGSDLYGTTQGYNYGTYGY